MQLRLARAWAYLLPFVCALAHATDVRLVGMVGDHAVVVVDGSAPHVLAVGNEFLGVKLLSTTRDGATVLVDGRRETIGIGQLYGSSANAGRASVTVTVNSQGAFTALGSINGHPVNFIIDTGATLVVISGEQADQMGVAWRSAPTAMASTANGQVPFHFVKLNQVKLGDIVLTNVDCAVQQTGLGSNALLGQAFLNRTEMQRTGTEMVLTKRY
jgi:aspartyl protease family protein